MLELKRVSIKLNDLVRGNDFMDRARGEDGFSGQRRGDAFIPSRLNRSTEGGDGPEGVCQCVNEQDSIPIG